MGRTRAPDARLTAVLLAVLLVLSCKSAPKEGEEMAFQSIDGIAEHVYNYVTATTDTDGYTHFARFYPEQLEAYSHNSMYREMANTSAGVLLSFSTTGDTVKFKCKTTPRIKKLLPFMQQISISSVLYALKCLPPEALKNRVFLDGVDFLADGKLLDTKKPIRGTMKFRFDNPDGKMVAVKIYFPIIFELDIKDLQVNGTVEATAPKEKILCLGDSITQGMISGYPSENYVALLARHLDVDAVNQGVGGYIYQQHSLRGLEAFNRQFGPPKFITVAYGTNDWYQKIPETVLQKNIAEYYQQLTAIFPATPIYVITPIWRGDAELASRGIMPFPQIAGMIQKETAPYPAITLIDGMTLVPQDFAYFSDGYLHPNAAAFAIMAAGIAANLFVMVPE